jgi:large subunit ribosomal protein L15
MINTLPSPKTTKKKKIVGRGIGSKKGGHTTGRGQKGQTSRAGYSLPYAAFEGGQNPITRRQPKYKGFTRNFITSKDVNVALALSEVADKFEAKSEVSMKTLIEKGLIKQQKTKFISVKVLFDKAIEKELKFVGLKVSKTAKDSIEKAGGSVE